IFPVRDADDAREISLRSPLHWLGGISTPTYLIEGSETPGNIAELDELCGQARNRQVHCVPASGLNHFSVIDAAARKLAANLEPGMAGEVELLRSQDFRGEMPTR